MSSPIYQQNIDAVQQISNPSVRGIKTGKVKKRGSTTYIEIEVGTNDRKFVPEDDLILLRPSQDGIDDLLKNLQFGNIGDLVRLLTFHKISSNISNIFYAMQASRTDFHPYQFKPVYKFIESLNHRILIADEVGLGKTIEAGLIWLEAKARFNAQRLLVVCPSMLREKWKKELKFRFDTKAEIYNAQGFIDLINDFRREGQITKFAAVCSLNTIRQNSVQKILSEFKEEIKDDSFKFDLVIIDEAHHLRNTHTKSHTVGKTLSELAKAMILLTATPIQLGNQDLFHLLKLLDENEFSEQWQFEQLINDNTPIIHAQNLLRYHPPNLEAIYEEVKPLEQIEIFQNNSILKNLLARLKTISPNNRQEIVETGLLLEKLNLLSSHISRTRKREVTEWRVLRQPESLKVEFSEGEAKFYQSVTEAVQNRINSFSGNKIHSFALMMPQRQMSSCIPAMVEHYRNQSFKQNNIDMEILDELGFDIENSKIKEKANSWLELEQLVEEWDDSTPDSKFDILLEALINRFEREPDAKVIIFSYFKKTLIYLNRKLNQKGFAPIMIHGDIPMEERQDLIETFRSNSSRRILLSSEVGSEGIDLQFCRIIFNYDLPWNPMKVEQRIGRLDRLGQKADKISIVNFAVADTIEEKILHRLYNRIGIFERSLGDLEPILGELTQELSYDLLSRKLSQKQIADRIEQTSLAAANRRLQEEKLIEESSVFLGSADYILEQIDIARNLGRRITSEDIRRFIEDFFDNTHYHGTSINWNSPKDGFATIKLSNSAQNELRRFCQSQNPPLQTTLIYNSNPNILCFDNKQAQVSHNSEMLTHFHPLIQWIKETHQNNKTAFFPTSAVELKTNLVAEGDYLLAVQFWEFKGIKNTKRIEYEVVSFNNAEIATEFEAEKLLQEILKFGTTWEYAERIVNSENILDAWEIASDKLGERCDSAWEEFIQDNKNLKLRREIHLNDYIKRKEQSANKAIQTINEKPILDENSLRMQYGIIEKLHQQGKEKFEKLQTQSKTSKEFKEIAAILCRVKN